MIDYEAWAYEDLERDAIEASNEILRDFDAEETEASKMLYLAQVLIDETKSELEKALLRSEQAKLLPGGVGLAFALTESERLHHRLMVVLDAAEVALYRIGEVRDARVLSRW